MGEVVMAGVRLLEKDWVAGEFFERKVMPFDFVGKVFFFYLFHSRVGLYCLRFKEKNRNKNDEERVSLKIRAE